MHILILGGTGAMGVPLVEQLAQEPENNVVVTSRVPHRSSDRVKYIQGDAHDQRFLDEILETHKKFDAIVDFMIYNTEEFRGKVSKVTAATGQYLFLSSSRVYDKANGLLTEESARLLDRSSDTEYLKTEEYALAKARQEDLLEQSGKKNWTIIRPYITYNTERLQLGIFEKESWLYRAMHGRTIVFPRDIAERQTTLSYGGDVAKCIALLIGKEKALGEKVHITAPESIPWRDVLEIYLDTLEEQLGKRSTVVYSDSPEWLRDIKKNYDVVRYDRLYDRRFDNTKLYSLCGLKPSFLTPQEGLAMCLTTFIKGNGALKKVHWKYEAYVDRMTGGFTPLYEIPGMRGKWRYIKNRYMPLERIAKK